MAQKLTKAARRHNGSALGIANSSAATCGSGYPIFSLFVQEPVDLVDLLTARSGVAASTVRAHVEAFGLGGRQ